MTRSRASRPRVVATLGATALVIAALVATARSVSAAPPQRAESEDPAAVSRRLDELQAAQQQILRMLEVLQRQIAELRAPATPGPRPVPVPTEPISIAGAFSKGRPDAPVVVLEYSDFQCPFCAEFARQVLPDFLRTFVDTGKVRLVFKHLPLVEIHPQAIMAAEAGECAGRQGRFWEMHDLLFENQRALDESALLARAGRLSLDMNAFGTCVRGDGKASVREQLTEGRRLGISGTPSFLVGVPAGPDQIRVVQILQGTKDLAQFQAVIDSLPASPR